MKIVFYVVVLLIVLKVIVTEFKDLFNPEGVDGKGKSMDGGGKHIYPYKYKKDDKAIDIIRKSKKLSDYNCNTITWRRCVLMSVLIIVIGQYTVNGVIPECKDFIVLLFVCFSIIKGFFSFYKTHYDSWASMYMKQNLLSLRRHLKYTK